jgi:hypothetical protein
MNRRRERPALIMSCQGDSRFEYSLANHFGDHEIAFW